MTSRSNDNQTAPAGIPPDVWYTLDESAAIARRTPNAMRQLRVKGRGPRVRKVDGRLMVSGTDLQAWLRGEDADPIRSGRTK
jgi:hypothetical protein